MKPVSSKFVSIRYYDDTFGNCVLNEHEPSPNDLLIFDFGSSIVLSTKWRDFSSGCRLMMLEAQCLPTGDASRSATNLLAISSISQGRRGDDRESKSRMYFLKFSQPHACEAHRLTPLRTSSSSAKPWQHRTGLHKCAGYQDTPTFQAKSKPIN